MEQAFILTRNIDVGIKQVINLIIHFDIVQKLRDYHLQMYDQIYQPIIEKKERNIIRYNIEVSKIFHNIGLLFMFYQKKTGKLKSE